MFSQFEGSVAVSVYRIDVFVQLCVPIVLDASNISSRIVSRTCSEVVEVLHLSVQRLFYTHLCRGRIHRVLSLSVAARRFEALSGELLQ